MFSGIVEVQAKIKEVQKDQNLLRITVEKPSSFNDLSIGDSIATDGICLTVERFDEQTVQFALGAETLQVTGWTVDSLKEKAVNLERSLRFGDRVHGHIVSGHVDAVGTVKFVKDLGGSTRVDIEFPLALSRFVWPKGSWAVNGVSLTINSVEGNYVSHVLIPETLKRTNLGAVKLGEKVNLEVDMFARGIVRAAELGAEAR
jgi:riboflavin synthase